MTYEEAVHTVDSLQRFVRRPGLERIERLLAEMGNPHKALRFVHVAGTNGKGSVSEMIAKVLERAGYRTGLFISPHVTDFCERIQVNGIPIPHGDLTELVEEYLPLIRRLEASGIQVTEFEWITALGFEWFRRQDCQLVVLEVGLGGRFDATNIIDAPLVSVITSISLDHTAVLGDSIEQIAFEKSGIMKQGGICVCYPDQPRAALNMLKITAEVMKNRFVIAGLNDLMLVEASIDGTQLLWKNGIPVRVAMAGEHQMKNAATALSVSEELRGLGWQISDRAVQEGIAAARLPARLEVLSRSPVVLLDGAHNPDGIRVLARAVKKQVTHKRIVGLTGMMRDKDVDSAVRELDGIFSSVVTVAPNGPRALPAEELAQYWEKRRIPAQPAANVEEGLRLALAKAGGEPLLICGSLYLAGDIRPLVFQELERKKTKEN